MIQKLSLVNLYVCVFPLQDWDKAENIPDPDAKKPEDWDEEMDGEWEPPMISNPDYKVDLPSTAPSLQGRPPLHSTITTR